MNVGMLAAPMIFEGKCNSQRAMALSAGRPNVMTNTSTKKQSRAKRIEAVYQSMGIERAKEIHERIWEIASDFELTIEPAMDEAADEVEDHFDKLIAEGFSTDQIEAVLRHHKPERHTYWPYRDVRRIWTHRWVPNHKSKSRAA
jgi:hypothetical protein